MTYTIRRGEITGSLSAFVCLLALGIVGCIQSTAAAASWSESVGLPELTAREREFAAEIDVQHAPDDIGEHPPSRVVAQIINNEFYQWAEYDLVQDDETTFCIYLQSPVSGPLTREEAQTLLAASRRWLEQPVASPEYTVLCADDPQLDVPPLTPPVMEKPLYRSVPEHEEPYIIRWLTGPTEATYKPSKLLDITGSLKNVHGSDDRVRITDTETYPWNAICYLHSTFPTMEGRGSAALISPYCALTCAHVLYDLRTSAFVIAVTIAPGQRQTSAGGSVVRPYGTKDAIAGVIDPLFAQAMGFEYDYGAVFFEEPFTGIHTFMPVVFNHLPNIAFVAGYPAQVQGETNSQGMWLSADYVLGTTGTDNRILCFRADVTQGTSGGPVWEYTEPDTHRIVAIIVMGNPDFNGASRLVSQNQAAITEWMQWTPHTDPPPPPTPGSIGYPSSSSTGQYTVNWGSSSGATSYTLQRSKDGGSYQTVYTGANTSHQENTGNGSYRYRVRASNSAGNSDWRTGSHDVVVTIAPHGGSGKATRAISGTNVSISVLPGSGTSAWGVEEYIPPNLTVSNITGPSGTWDGDNRKVSWYSAGDTTASLGYTVAGPRGTYTISGTASFDGSLEPVSGDTDITIDFLHPADTNQDWRLIMAEAISYIAGWQNGNNPMGYAIRAAFLWQNGERYTYDATQSPPLCWVLNPSKSAKAGPATRSITGSAVVVYVSPPAGTTAWGVEEYIPAALTVSNMTGLNAAWDSANRKISWWSAGSAASQLGYSVSGPNGTYTLEGAASFDGVNSTVTGASQVTLGTTSPVGTSTRVISGTSVAITVSPGDDVAAWGVEEHIPATLTVSAITGSNGVWDNTNRKITWWGTTSNAAQLGYTLSGPAGTYSLSGHSSFDGVDVPTSGDTQVTIQAAASVLDVAPNSRNVGAGEGATTFTVRNLGPGVMNWTASIMSGGNWLHMPRQSGSLTGAENETVEVYFTNNSSGDSRTATVRFEALGADGSPAEVTIIQAQGWNYETLNWRVDYGNCWNRTGTITKPGATEIRLHFSTISVESDWDILVSDAGDSWSGFYTDVFSSSRAGDSISLTLTSDETVTGYFIIEHLEYLGASTGPATRSGSLFLGDPGDDCPPREPHDPQPSAPPRGCTGGRLLKTFAAPDIYEPVLPATPARDDMHKAAPMAPLAVRIRSNEQLNVTSLWGMVEWSDGADNDVVWLPVTPAMDGDGWMVYEPGEPWQPGEILTFTAGGATITGRELNTLRHSFIVADCMSNAPHSVYVEADAEHPGAYVIGPDMLYQEPVLVQLPVPSTLKPSELEVAYLFSDEAGTRWAPGKKVIGWMTPEPPRIVHDDDGVYLEFLVNHGGTVKVREKSMERTSASGGTGIFCGLAALLMLERMRRRKKEARPARRQPRCDFR